MFRLTKTWRANAWVAQEVILECMLILVCIGLAVLLHVVVGYKMVVLNLFYLPVVLAAFYLGRLRAGTLALFCVLMVSTVAAMDLPAFAPHTTPLIAGLSLAVWAAVMGLNAILVGTLSDERSSKLADLHEANSGVIEVLAQYLKSADPALQDRSDRVVTLSKSVARQMRLSEQEVDDICVAALLQDINNIEITARVVDRALGDLDQEDAAETHTFRGSELMQSLGTVLTTAMPLVVTQPADFCDPDAASEVIPFGAAIIRVVHRFDTLVYDQQEPYTAVEALDLMESELDGEYHPAVLHALGQIMTDLPARANRRLAAIEDLLDGELSGR